MCISLAYEGNKLAGCFHSVTFLHDGFEHPYANVIKKHFLVFDYLPKTLPNSIDSKTGLIKPAKKEHQKKRERKTLISRTPIGILNLE